MALAIGAVTQVKVTESNISLKAPAATGATGAVTYQWYRSQTSGFVPGAGNLIAGATALSFSDVVPPDGTNWFYVLQATDETPTTVSTPQIGISALSYAATHATDAGLAQGTGTNRPVR